MAHVFISYSSQDEGLAQFIYRHLTAEAIGVFLAPVSLRPGDHWSTEIMNNLRGSTWVILLASRAACQSPFVQQELGGAIYGGKKIIPVVWDMSPAELPGWAHQYQAVDLRGATPEAFSARIGDIAKDIKGDINTGRLIIAIIFLALALAKR
jgi:hypothetical protein